MNAPNPDPPATAHVPLLSRKNWLRLGTIVVLVLLLSIVWCKGKFVLSLGLGLVALVIAVCWMLRAFAPRVDAALRESASERFRRIVGLYRSIPESIRIARKNQSVAAEFENLCKTLETWVDARSGDFAPDKEDAPDYVHNLHLLYLQLAPLRFLGFSMQALRNDFRDTVSSAVYDAYLLASTDLKKLEGKDADADKIEELIRADATYLANETRRQVLAKQHVEKTRQLLMKAALRSWCIQVVPLLALVFAYLFCQTCADQANRFKNENTGVPWMVEFGNSYLLNEHKVSPPASPDPKVAAKFRHTALFQVMIGAAMIALACVAGASGGMLSVIQRVQASAGNADANSDLRALSQSEAAVFFAPVTGAMFAVVLSAMFSGGVVKGSIFPEVGDNTPWFFILWNAQQMAIWLVWAFIAGFSERLVPDMLDGVTRKLKDANANAPAHAVNVSALSPSDPKAAAVVAPVGAKTPAMNPQPILHSHPDAVPADASELTITGEGFNESSEISIDGRPKAKSAVLEVTATSLRFQLEPPDLAGKTQIVVTVKNPEPGGGVSPELTIQIDEAGG